jgi:hypothetical protein
MTTLSNPWPVHRDEGSTTPGATTSDALIETKRPNDSRRGSLRRTQSFLRLLQHYDAPGTRPPSARTDPSIAQRDSIPFSLWNLGRIGYAAALKGAYPLLHLLKPLSLTYKQPRRSQRTSFSMLYGVPDASHGHWR